MKQMRTLKSCNIIDVQNVFQYISTFEGKNYTKEIIVTARECSVSNCITWSAVYECQTCENDYALDTSKQWISTIPPPTNPDPDPIGSNSSTPINNNTASNGTNSTTKNEENLNKNEKIVSMSVIATLYVCAVATSIISLSSPQSLWVSINHHQILMLLLLTGVYFPK